METSMESYKMDAGNRKKQNQKNKPHSSNTQVVLESEVLHGYCFSNFDQQESQICWIPESLSVPKSPSKAEQHQLGACNCQETHTKYRLLTKIQNKLKCPLPTTNHQ